MWQFMDFQLNRAPNRFLFLLFLCLLSCTKQSLESSQAKVDTKSANLNENINRPDPEAETLKKIAPHFRFAASLEREILKSIRPDFNLPMTQFEILSTILDQRVGIKKNFGPIDCKLYALEKNKNVFSFFKQCQNPKVLIAEIEIKSVQQMAVRFFIKDWANVVGQSVALTASDRICVLNIEEDKLKRLTCDNTVMALDQSSEIQELRLKEFVFDQKAEFQVQVSGGFYKNLVEHRKLNLKIPFEGKIKIIEKELKVRDDFANLIQSQKVEVETIQSPKAEVTDGKEDSKENNDKDEKKIGSEGQEVGQEASQEIGQKTSEQNPEGRKNETGR